MKFAIWIGFEIATWLVIIFSVLLLRAGRALPGSVGDDAEAGGGAAVKVAIWIGFGIATWLVIIFSVLLLVEAAMP